MATSCNIRKSLRSNQFGAHRRRRSIGGSAAAGAFLAFGLTPLAVAPPAPADADFDWLADLLNPLIGAVDPSAGANAGDLSALLPAAAIDAPVFGWLDQVVYTPLHAGIESWINSPLGQAADGFINTRRGRRRGRRRRRRRPRR